MEANHDIHNRSRNRKQERWPRWKQNGQQKWSNKNIATKTNNIPDNADHQQLTKSLHELCITRQLIESPTGTQKRRRVLNDLDAMLFAWSESLLPGSTSYAENIISPNTDKSSAPSLLSFGSYRLGVHTPDADVDCLVLAPPHATRDDFFGSWVDVLKQENRVSELHPVASAYTPVIKFEMDGVKIDLIFARANNSKWLTEQRMKMTQPLTGDDGQIEERVEMIVDDSLLIGLDETSVRSVNGVRVAQFLLDMLDGDRTRIDNFRLTLRAVKEWARVHGLYANVLGFLGGVNWAILVDLVSQRNPDAPASKLLQIFFRTFATWKWPNPVLLSKQNHPPKGVKPLPIWDPNENFRDSKHMMPIITPCYPQMNSSYNVGEPQLRRLHDELWRASKLSDEILSGRKKWGVLFEGNDFFKQHTNYLQVNIVGTNEDEFRSWFGICEARMRLLIAGLESPSAGVRAYPFAKFFHRREGEKYVSSFFIALRFAQIAKKINLGPLVTDYLQVVNSFEGRGRGMDLTIHLVSKKDLPSFVFAADEVKGNSDAKNDAETPSKVNNQQSDVTGKATNVPNDDKQAETPLPSSSKKKTLDEANISPSANISPLKRTRIS
mmetsp:Transcript_13865/g.30210  ORF Transcript_13865/g.30210 Transcript_13865/m.30210 type:complete len:608 (-) Transcript_13865:1410-3233(-)